MNELMITLKSGGGWLYYETDCNTANDALNGFYKSCENSGINTDNMAINFVELRNTNGESIDAMTL